MVHNRWAVLRGKDSRFTLVELLFFIMIICILAAFLLPLLQRGVEAGRRTACANNMKQMHAALSTYSDECNGFIPVVCYYPFGGFVYNSGIPFCQDYLSVDTQARPATPNVLTCPSKPARVRMIVTATFIYWYPDYFFQGTSLGAQRNLYLRMTKVAKGGPLGPVAMVDDSVTLRSQGGADVIGNNHYTNAEPAGGNVLYGNGMVRWLPTSARHYRLGANGTELRFYSDGYLMWWQDGSAIANGVNSPFYALFR